MTLTTPYSATFIVGDGETKTFSYLFEEVSPNFISVMVYNSLTGLISTPTYVIDTDQKQVIFGEDTPAPTADETVCIYRNTPNVQDVAFRTLHGYDAQTLENILSKIVAMIQEIKSNYFSTQVLQGDPWQLDLLSSEDDGATVNIDYTAKKLVKGLYFRITSGNLQVSADGTNYITMPKSADVVEFRQHETVKEDLTVEYRLQYRVGNTWYNAESNAESTANEALQVAEEARDIANDAKDIAQATSDKVDTFDARLTIAEQDSSDAKELAQEAIESVGQFDARITQAEQNANQAKTIATNASTAVNNHITNYNNPHQVTKAQVGLGNVDNTSDLNKPISTATQNALNNITDLIPAQATTTNQLADKGFVNSSVSTNTANFIGTFNSVAELEAYSGTVTNNDYAFVVGTDSAGNTTYNRYKYNGNTQQWVYEYTLNNSSFTAAQWATINSGGTAADVALARSAIQPSDLGNGTITITQGGTTRGTFTTNQSNNTTIDLDAGGSGNYHPDMFDCKWADHQLNDVQWLRADTFSWQAGSVYESAYQHLADDIDGKTLQSETIGNTTIQFYLADDGHKICPASEESNVVAIYNATGVAWYYIIDTTNERFKLPRTKFGFTGLRDTVGNYVAPGLPNITGKFAYDVWQSASYDSGAFYNDGGNKRRGTDNDSNSSGGRTAFDASRSSAIYGASTTVQPPATQMYLYFYVGEFTQTAIENTAGLNAELFNNKVDKGHQVIEFQAPTAQNNYTWYRKYADGWVEQGRGLYIQSSATETISLPIEMSSAKYTLTALGANAIKCQNLTRTTFQLVTTANTYLSWQVCGMAS